MYKKEFMVGWAEIDANYHMGNTAFLNRASDIRMMFFADHGFAAEEFQRKQIGAVVRKDELEYFREIQVLGKFTVNFQLAGLAEDGSRMCLRHEFYTADGSLAARVKSTGGWLDLRRRKLISPPEEIVLALNELTKTDDFAVLPSSLK